MLECFEISGGTPLCGSVTLQGSKNAALPVLAACLLHRGKTVLHNVPDIRDTAVMLQIMEQLGCEIEKKGRTLIIDAKEAKQFQVDAALGRQMRSTILLLGALLGRNQKAVLPFPGGCIIGMRPIDIHITAMQKFGAVFEEQDGMLLAEAGRWDAQTILLRFPSVGATENAILAAVYAKGLTCIQNCAREPEIAELCCFLKEKGAKIQGEGTSCIWIRGVDVLQDSTYTLMPDRIVAGTYLIAGAATRGKITLHGIQMHNMEAVAELLRQMGAAIVCEKDTCYLDGRKAVRPLECVCTDTYPGFPTDLQSQLMAALCIAEGKSRIKEQIFEERFRIAAWLNRMGAKVVTDGREAVIHGVKRLQGMTVEAQELRGGAALVLAGLIAEGKTQVYGSSFTERGYEDLAGDLRLLGAVVSRKTTER